MTQENRKEESKFEILTQSLLSDLTASEGSRVNRVRIVAMATTPEPGTDNHQSSSTTEQAPQISGLESETSVARQVDLNVNVPTPNPTYNPYMLMQQLGTTQSYSAFQNHDSSQQPQYNSQQGYVPGSVHGGSFYTAPPQELYPRYHVPVVQEQRMQGFSEVQQQNYMQQVEDFVQNSQTAFETSRHHQGQVQRVLPRRLPHMRQRIRRRNRTSRGPVANMVYNNNREQSTAASITGSVTSGPVLQTPVVDSEESQERLLSRLTSVTAAAIEEATSGIGENFECNICFQKANEAVVTCCGHLFCWPCLYRWLHVHSYHKECPVCKGSIAECSIIPIYGRESALASARLQSALGSEIIPPRPAARRVESARQQQRERGRDHEQGHRTEIAQVVTEIEDEEEGEPRAPGAEEAPTSGLRRGEDSILTTASRSNQDVEHHNINHQLVGREASEPTQHSLQSSGYLQRRFAFRREQLRQALANSRYSAALNQIPGASGGEMLAASALLSQEWEHIINGSRFVADPTQAAAWLASMHARLANMEGGTVEQPSSDAAAQQQRRQMIASAVSQLSQPPQEEDSGSIGSRLASVRPSQVADWITTMRTRLNNIGQLVHNLERPIGSIATPDVGNPNPQLQLDDTDDDLNSNEFLAELNVTVAQPQGPTTASGSEQSPVAPVVVAALQSDDDGDERGDPELRSVPEAENVVRRSRRRREHGEEASQVVAAAPEEGAEPAPHESDQLPLTRKRRRRLD